MNIWAFAIVLTMAKSLGIPITTFTEPNAITAGKGKPAVADESFLVASIVNLDPSNQGLWALVTTQYS